ncbi:cysteine-rich CWC family protein [Calidifontibacillus oryziterrae]|uniref:cysteine-rich CWC family protein n=1 Tax=Calidifontibacillus oryziterrae TaxID=1191699 RepID=UPI000314F531|nr:cysteine-rich CWC family protein [Calidifontibacillus oryziterrae]
MSVDVKKCPICNKENNCGKLQGQKVCWCVSETFPGEIFELVPEEKRNKACICKDCVQTFNENLLLNK